MAPPVFVYVTMLELYPKTLYSEHCGGLWRATLRLYGDGLGEAVYPYGRINVLLNPVPQALVLQACGHRVAEKVAER